MRTIDDKYSLTNITNILDKLGKSKFFTTLNLATDFYQIEMDPADTNKIAFSCENRQNEF